jgi:5-methylcytosine-specific restriction endonuclease McrA
MARQRKRGTASGSLMLAFSPLPLVFMVSQSTEAGTGLRSVLFLLFGALVVWWSHHTHRRRAHNARGTNPRSITELGLRIPIGSRTIPQDVKIAVSVRDEGKCQRCSSTKDLQYDHVIPYSMGGDNSVENIQLLCRRCNAAKSNRYVG